MPDQAVTLFLFSLVASAVLIWAAYDLRSRTQAGYLDLYFLFILTAIGYGVVNWVGPYLALYVTPEGPQSTPTELLVIFVLFAIPLLLLKLYFFIAFFQGLANRPLPSYFPRVLQVLA